jgi:hypothetical protein
MNPFIYLLMLSIISLIGMLVFFEVGRKIGLNRLKRNPAGLASGIGASEGVVFALLGLLIAFTFNGAASRFEDRRHLIVEEANDIGTAYLRIDLLAAEDQPAMRELFKRYTEQRLKTYREMDNAEAIHRNQATNAEMQLAIWRAAILASKNPNASVDATKLLVPALNAMIDITTTRTVASRNHPPIAIYFLLFGLSLISAMLIGYGTSPNTDRVWLHKVAFALVITLTSYIIIDLEYPRLGLIRIDADDQILIDTRSAM